MLTTITDIVLGHAVRAVAHLQHLGHDVSVSINVSPADLIDMGLPDRIRWHLETHAVAAERLVIEVTEDTVMADRGRAITILTQLRAIGLGVSVDDYGTGQASLAYLRDLPISEMKLDRVFLSGVPHHKHNTAIVKSTIELAHALGLPIVTEGIEDAATLQWLQEIGCDLGQGYEIARPLPLPELTAWLSARAASTHVQRAIPLPR